MADSTLAAIRKKVRRLTRTPSEQQLSTADIDEYVNTFIQYDFPQHLRLFTMRRVLTFYTEPNIDNYGTNDIVDDPLNNFKDKYTAVHSPIYVAGYEAKLVQDITEFTGMYPITNKIEVIAQGAGANTVAGTLSDVPIIRGMVTFSATGLLLSDSLTVTDDGEGTLIGDVAGPGGTINYETGEYLIEFIDSLEVGTNVNALTVPYTAARPDTILYFGNRFIIRPIPDQVYPITVEVDIRPTELLLAGSSPDLEQWWQYIAFATAKKIFEDRSDSESIQDIMPALKEQELLVLRRTIVQQSKERSSTIYSDGAWIGYGNWRSGKF